MLGFEPYLTTYCVTMGNPLTSLSLDSFVCKEDHSGTHLIVLLCGLDEITHRELLVELILSPNSVFIFMLIVTLHSPCGCAMQWQNHFHIL